MKFFQKLKQIGHKTDDQQRENASTTTNAPKTTTNVCDATTQTDFNQYSTSFSLQLPGTNHHSFNLKTHTTAIRKRINKLHPNKNGFTQQQREILMIDKFINELPAEYKDNFKNHNFDNLDKLLQQTIKLQQHIIQNKHSTDSK
jgi:hypothetical protein